MNLLCSNIIKFQLKFQYFLALLVMVGLFSSLGLVFFSDDQKSFAQLTSSVKSYKVEGGTGTVAVNPNTNLVYVTNTYTDTVSVFDGSTNNLLSTFEVGRTPFGIGINPNTNMLYVGREHSDILAVVDCSTNEQNLCFPLLAPASSNST